MTHDARRVLTPSRLEAPRWIPARYVDSLAVVIVAHDFLSYGTDGRHEALSSVWVFENENSLYNDRKPTETLDNVKITNGHLYWQLWKHDQIRKSRPEEPPLIGYLGQGDPMTEYRSAQHPNGTRPWKILDLDDDTHKLVIEVWTELNK